MSFITTARARAILVVGLLLPVAWALGSWILYRMPTGIDRSSLQQAILLTAVVVTPLSALLDVLGAVRLGRHPQVATQSLRADRSLVVLGWICGGACLALCLLAALLAVTNGFE